MDSWLKTNSNIVDKMCTNVHQRTMVLPFLVFKLITKDAVNLNINSNVVYKIF